MAISVTTDYRVTVVLADMRVALEGKAPRRLLTELAERVKVLAEERKLPVSLEIREVAAAADMQLLVAQIVFLGRRLVAPLTALRQYCH